MPGFLGCLVSKTRGVHYQEATVTLLQVQETMLLHRTCSHMQHVQARPKLRSDQIRSNLVTNWAKLLRRIFTSPAELPLNLE